MQPPIQGFGEFRYFNGDFYSGNWMNSRRDGQGKCVYRNGSIFEGMWANDLWHGTG